MDLSDRELCDAGFVTLRRKVGEGGPLQEIHRLSRRIADLQLAIAQRDALLNLYQERVEALSECT
ncbi:MAG: hypothetical protein HY692_02820 [Cyanobacteria bacterium NC_groundwater_1444_Ag_S-0.65um_54_12]|nr:hypothetical protein [Cyanobacteria bacterium NC_groundwater_1444_Ag_S-0.65um_54_12]